MYSHIFVLLPILIGFVLDLIIGDPYTWPHPIKLFGILISKLEKLFNKGNRKKLKGGGIAVILIGLVYVFFFIIDKLAGLEMITYCIATSIWVFYGLANRTLINEVMKVERKLSHEGLEAGRKQLSYIVGRDTAKLDEQAIRKAALETLSENLSDGVIAPLLYLFVGGVPLMFAYKMVNTLDSMIGYKNERYKEFGMIAAKIDDVFNFIPARITALLIAIVSLSSRSLRFLFKYGSAHSSPNAGYPESALAGALNCRFGGPSVYFNKVVDKPYIGKEDRLLLERDVKYSCSINLKVSILFLFIGLVVKIMLNSQWVVNLGS